MLSSDPLAALPALDIATTVVDRLVHGPSQIPAERLMIIGAHARDYWHQYFNRPERPTTTSDADLALSVDARADYAEFTRVLRPTGDSKLRFDVDSTPTDLIPFGAIEDPRGEVTRPGRPQDQVDVFGMQEVFTSAPHVRLSNGIIVKLPSPAGYAALKAKAWIDRSPRPEHKDGVDLALVCRWYRDWDKVGDRIYADNDADGSTMIERHDFDPDTATAELLGRDIAAVLGPLLAHQLAASWQQAGMSRFHHYFQVMGTRPPGPSEAGPEQILGALAAGFSSATDKSRTL